MLLFTFLIAFCLAFDKSMDIRENTQLAKAKLITKLVLSETVFTDIKYVDDSDSS